jgi:hypothetical protein
VKQGFFTCKCQRTRSMFNDHLVQRGGWESHRRVGWKHVALPSDGNNEVTWLWTLTVPRP